MKTLICLLCFMWCSCSLSIEQAQVKAYGHWPYGFPISHVAVISQLSHKLEPLDPSEADDDPLNRLAMDPVRELGLAAGTGLVALIPAFVYLDFWW